MFGWINDCTEKLIISKFGVEKWHEIKKKAGCRVKDGAFIRHQYYPDQSTVNLVVAASEELGLPVDDVLEAFGQYFMEFTRREGYENVLNCQGSTLRLWLSNLNALHDHLESSLPSGFVAPVFWCEDDEEVEGSILLHYYSKRGSLLAQVVVGVVKEVAKFHFDVQISMKELAKQDENDSKFTTWRISALDASQQWKLTGKTSIAESTTEQPESPPMNGRSLVSEELLSTDEKVAPSKSSTEPPKNSDAPLKCPFSSMSLNESRSSSNNTAESAPSASSEQCPFSSMVNNGEQAKSSKKDEIPTNDKGEEMGQSVQQKEVKFKVSSLPALKLKQKQKISLSSDQMKKVFPYHLVANENFTIVQVGNYLPKLIEREDLLGKKLPDVLNITRPIYCKWHWPTMHKVEDQTFFMKPAIECKGDKNKRVKLKGNMVRLSESPWRVMFVLSPDAKNVSELQGMKLTMSDLPLHSFQRDAVFLGEHISSEVRSTHKLDRLSKKLENEKALTNALLYQLLPKKIAHTLRSGKVVEPEHYDHVTCFFSHIVGFNSICDMVPPWDIIDMLNRLYTVMDFVADKFKLYKVETIADSYMACSGMPTPTLNHAHNIANFSLVVRECAKHVISPLDGNPIQIRMGMHCGSCMGGVVGNLTPKYTMFGDMVNVTARHETSGEGGRILISHVAYEQLTEFSLFETEQYQINPRGLVNMKGKGKLYTYWLDGATDTNSYANQKALKDAYEEAGNILAKKTWKVRTYFRRRGSGDSSMTLPNFIRSDRSIDTTVDSAVSDQSAASTDDTDDDDDEDDDDSSYGSSDEERQRFCDEN